MLTEQDLDQLRPRSKRYKKHDADGLYILVKPDGSKSWRVKYLLGGSSDILKGGIYPDLDLAGARAWCARAKLALQMNINPQSQKSSPPQSVRIDEDRTFGYITREWHSHASRFWSEKYASRILRNFEKDIFPELGHMPIELIDGPRLRAVLKKIGGRGALEPSRRLRSQCSSVFAFAIAEGKARFDPGASIVDAPPRRNLNSHRAVLKVERVPAFFAALSNKNVGKLTNFAIRWTLLTMVRSQETRRARYDEFEDLDGATPQWRIPAARIKTGIEHIVPLSKQAVRLISDVKNLGLRSEHVFSSNMTSDGVISHTRMLDCIKSIGCQGEVTVHGFRGLASTVLNEATRIDDKGELVRLWDSDWVERQLAHVESRQSRRAYNAAEWIGPRRRMMQWWADWLDVREFGEARETSVVSRTGYQFVN